MCRARLSAASILSLTFCSDFFLPFQFFQTKQTDDALLLDSALLNTRGKNERKNERRFVLKLWVINVTVIDKWVVKQVYLLYLNY